MSLFGPPSKKTTYSNKGTFTEKRSYSGGKCVGIKHTNNTTGKSHGHKVAHGWFGAYAGKKTK